MTSLPGQDAASIADFYRSSAYARFEQRHRGGGTFGIEMMDVHQGAIEIVDPAVPQVIFSRARGTGSGEVDVGDGWRPTRFVPTSFDVQPAHQAVAFRVPALHVRAVAVPRTALTRLLDEAGVPATAFDGLAGRFTALSVAGRGVDSIWRAASGGGPGVDLMVDGLFMTLVGALLHELGRSPVARDARALDDVRRGRRTSRASRSPPRSGRPAAGARGSSVSGSGRSTSTGR